MKKKLAILAAFVMTMSMFAACGNDDSSSSAPAADNTSSVVEDTSSEAPAESEDASSEDESSEPEEDPFEFNGTLETTGDYPGDWKSPSFIVGNSVDDISGQFDYNFFEEYKDTGCVFTIKYTLDKKIDMANPDAGKTFYDFYSVAPCSAGASGWQKLYTIDQSFLNGYDNETEVLVEDPEDPSNKIVSDDYAMEAYFQNDGFIVICKNDDGVWDEEGTITFGLSAEGVQYVLDDLGDADDGSKWGGLIFMVHGPIIQSVTVAAPAE